MGYLRSGYEGLRVDLGTSLGWSWRVDSGSILEVPGTHSRTISRKPHNNLYLRFIRPWVGPRTQNMTNVGPGHGPGSTRYSPPRYPPTIPPPGYTPTPPPHPGTATADVSAVPARKNSVVGLISVGQLSLSPGFSDIRTMTEVYNL